jgi:hypothetical protein
MPCVSLGEFRTRGIVIAQYIFVPVDYANDRKLFAVINDPYVVATTAQDLATAATKCAAGHHHDFDCNCVMRSRSAERPMLVLVEI